MKKYLAPLLAFFLFSSCEGINDWFAPFDQRIEGVWEFDRVIFHDYLNRETLDITDDFWDNELEFFRNGDLVFSYPDSAGDWVISGGLWESFEDRDCYRDDCDRVDILLLTFDNFHGGFQQNHQWILEEVDNRRFYAREIVAEGEVEYRLRRIY